MNREASLDALHPPAAAAAVARPRSSDLMNVLAQLEAGFPVHEWRVADVAVWPLVRVRWFFAEWVAHYNAASPAAGGMGGAAAYAKRVVTGAVAAAKARWRDAAGNDPGGEPRDVVFLSDGLSFTRLQGQWLERFCDPLIAAANTLGLQSALWTPQHQYYSPRRTRSQYVQPGVDRASVKGELRARTKGATVHLPGRERTVEWLAARGFGTSALQEAQILSDGCRVRAVADFYRSRLERVRPRLGFVVSYYSVENMGFVLACHELGIPTVDIQHGVQGDFHPAYAAWPRAEPHALLPDRFWVWSPEEAEVVSRWSEGTRHAPVVGGNPWTEVWRPESSWPGAAEALARVRELREKSGSRQVVLVTLQFGLSPAEQLDGLARLLRAAGDRFSFWVRLHPLMLDRREEVRTHLAAGGEFELDLCTDLPLHALLPFADVHLTHSSSTVIEAAQFGLKSVLTSAYGTELFASQVAGGVAFEHTGPEAGLVTLLARLASSRSHGTVDTSSVVEALRGLIADAGSRRTHA